jgi:hypothetical protein
MCIFWFLPRYAVLCEITYIERPIINNTATPNHGLERSAVNNSSVVTNIPPQKILTIVLKVYARDIFHLLKSLNEGLFPERDQLLHQWA